MHPPRRIEMEPTNPFDPTMPRKVLVDGLRVPADKTGQELLKDAAFEDLEHGYTLPPEVAEIVSRRLDWVL